MSHLSQSVTEMNVLNWPWSESFYFIHQILFYTSICEIGLVQLLSHKPDHGWGSSAVQCYMHLLDKSVLRSCWHVILGRSSPLLKGCGVAGLSQHDTLDRYSGGARIHFSKLPNSHNNRKVESFSELLMISVFWSEDWYLDFIMLIGHCS